MTALSGERIQEIKGRLAAITPGPWALDEDTMSVWQLASGGTICDINADHQTGDHQPQGDAELIANAPSDIADLLAEVERLQAMVPDGLTPTRYDIDGSGGRILNDDRRVEIAERCQRDGSCKWAVIDTGQVLARNGEWEWEPQPSSRDDDFIARTRFDSVNDALAAYRASRTDGGING